MHNIHIYILYIAIGCVIGLIVLGASIGISRKIRRRKFNWWYYADANDADGGSRASTHPKNNNGNQQNNNDKLNIPGKK